MSAAAANNPRILKLIQLEASGRIKPEHQQELDGYRTAGIVKAPSANSGGLPTKDAEYINSLRDSAGGAQQTARIYDRIAPVLDRLPTGPTQGVRYNMVIPEQDDAGWAKVAKGMFGSAVRGIGGLVGRQPVTPQNIADYQYVRAQQSERTAARQLEQKGPQTAADAAMYRLSDISAYNAPQVNAKIVGEGKLSALLTAQKPDFYIRWAKQHGGLSALDPQGRSVEAAWNDRVRAAQERLPANIEKARQARLAKSGWKIERIN